MPTSGPFRQRRKRKKVKSSALIFNTFSFLQAMSFCKKVRLKKHQSALLHTEKYFEKIADAPTYLQ